MWPVNIAAIGVIDIIVLPANILQLPAVIDRENVSHITHVTGSDACSLQRRGDLIDLLPHVGGSVNCNELNLNRQRQTMYARMIAVSLKISGIISALKMIS